MSRATEIIGRLEARRPWAVRLAEVVSLAVLVDPLLLRRARRRFVPEADAGTEADLWLSPLVRTRSPDGIVFPPEVAEALRSRLQGSGRLEEAWELTRELHGHLPPALQLEEEIAWLSASRAPGTADRIEELLRSALAALVVGERRGLAHWAAQALPRLPSGVRVRSAARMLEAGAHLRLGANARPLQAGNQTPDWTSWVAPADLPRVPVRLRLLPGEVELDSGATGGNLLQLPGTEPLVVDLIWDQPGDGKEHSVQVTFRKGETVRVKVPGQEVRLRTILGEVYDLRAAGTPAREVRDWILDFSELRGRPDPFFGRGRDLARLEDLIQEVAGSGSDAGILVTGGTGAGKTAMLGEFLDRREKIEGIVPHHFFRRGNERWNDVGAAERSLAAQLATRFPDLLPMAGHFSFLELLRQLPPLASGSPLVIVIDALSEAEERERFGEILPESPIPGVVFVTSMRFEMPFTIPASLREMELFDPDEDLEEYWSYYAPRFGLVKNAMQEAVQKSQKSFGVAEVLREWLVADAQRPMVSGSGEHSPRFLLEGWGWEESDRSSEGTLAALWREATHGQAEASLLFGLLAAARGPLPLSVLPGLVRQSAGTLLAQYDFLFKEERSGDESAFSWKEEVVRDFVAARIPMAMQHRQLAGFLASGLEQGDLTPAARMYALRHLVAHSLAANEESLAYRWGTRASFLAERCREVGLPLVRRDVQALGGALHSRETMSWLDDQG